MKADIMSQPIVTVDVSGMLCAQALAVVAQAMGRVSLGEMVRVRCDAEDVRRDLLAWASDRGHDVHDDPSSMLRIERRHGSRL